MASRRIHKNICQKRGHEGRLLGMDQRETDSESENLRESVEVEVIPQTDADAQEEEVLLEEEDDSAEEEEVVEEEVRYTPGVIPDGQLDATRLYLSLIHI